MSETPEGVVAVETPLTCGSETRQVYSGGRKAPLAEGEPRMVRLLVKLLVSTAVIFGIAYFSGGALLGVESFTAALLGAIVLGLVNTFIRPIVKLLTLPINLITLGLFSLVVNTLMLYLVTWVVPGLETVGFLRTMLAALIISIITSVTSWVIDRDD